MIKVSLQTVFVLEELINSLAAMLHILPKGFCAKSKTQKLLRKAHQRVWALNELPKAKR
ncbi:MAG: hypothetical protein ACTS42_00290 [Candidatus Hodgkinia cicadicola]